MSAPLDGRTAVPSFANESDNYVGVQVFTRGDRAALQPDIYSAFALVGVSETLSQAIEQVARLAAMGVHVVVNDFVKLILRTEQGEDRKRAIELCHLGGMRLTPELALRNLIGAFAPEARRSAMSTALFGAPR